MIGREERCLVRSRGTRSVKCEVRPSGALPIGSYRFGGCCLRAFVTSTLRALRPVPMKQSVLV